MDETTFRSIAKEMIEEALKEKIEEAFAPLDAAINPDYGLRKLGIILASFSINRRPEDENDIYVFFRGLLEELVGDLPLRFQQVYFLKARTMADTLEAVNESRDIDRGRVN